MGIGRGHGLAGKTSFKIECNPQQLFQHFCSGNISIRASSNMVGHGNHLLFRQPLSINFCIYSACAPPSYKRKTLKDVRRDCMPKSMQTK